MYSIYLDKVLLPIAPKSIKIGFSSQNKTLNLINHGEINMLKDPGLLDIEFDAMLPNTKYPFSIYKDGFESADKFIDKINKLKTDKKPFQFIVTRTRPDGTPLFNTNIKVSLEEYEINEDAEEGFDVILSIKLKQYKPFGTKKIKIEKSKDEDNKQEAKVEEKREADESKIMIGSDVIVNGRLHRDSYGKGPGQTRTNYKGKINLINEKGSHPYHVTTPEGSHLGWVTKDSVKGV
ncbi:hydrolase [Candidatus Arthromitus sp. SFB-turkey]|uniref:hydrolase n=1 Tax=Candidatus Arthromitus sp. SFB-turkey TaxID=1840217 RepID=UPI0007F4890E|nr:hydrolase [Candidatus Arthromitus sp. SFB-turkey]OAT89650.1 hydrolase [Candidatus Arthromitus sp. SFB-turkey]